jgi:hypothetical protein
MTNRCGQKILGTTPIVILSHVSLRALKESPSVNSNN